MAYMARKMNSMKFRKK